MRESITSLYQSSDLYANLTIIIAHINAIIDRSKKFKRFAVISNLVIFIKDKNKFEIWHVVMQNKLKANENWYSIERMTMTYVSIRLNNETYKYIFTRLNKSSSRRYITVDEIFENLKRIYANSIKMQTIMNAFTRLIQVKNLRNFTFFEMNFNVS